MPWRWVPLHEAIREAVAHREEWPPPILVIAQPPLPSGRQPGGPGQFCALPASAAPEARPPVLRLSAADLEALAACGPDTEALDAELDRIIREQARLDGDQGHPAAPRQPAMLQIRGFTR